MGVVHYVRNLLGDPNVASIAPSSQFAIRRTSKNVDFRRANVVVEYGAGGGCFTQYFLDRMPKDGVFLAFETNPSFAKQLRESIRDPRLHVIERSAEFLLDELAVRNLEHADYIVSGIPFSMIDADVKDRILRNTAAALHSNGKFLTYQFVPPTAAFDRFLKQPMERYFNVERVTYELLNLPPLRIYQSAPKPAAAGLKRAEKTIGAAKEIGKDGRKVGNGA